jgi:phosphoesterase RecJ-like protein
MSGSTPGRAVTPEDIAQRFAKETSVLVVAHESPDGDALGCVVALQLLADRLGVTCRGFIPGTGALPNEYRFLPGLDRILRGTPPALPAGSTVYLLDCACLVRSRTQDYGAGVTLVNIDHHQDNPGYADLNFLDPKAPSATAMVYEVLRAGGFPVDKDMATALYVGVVTDTGRFQYSIPRPSRIGSLPNSSKPEWTSTPCTTKCMKCSPKLA